MREFPRHNGNLFTVPVSNRRITNKRIPLYQCKNAPIPFRAPDDVLAALSKRRKAGENISAIIVQALRAFFKIKKP